MIAVLCARRDSVYKTLPDLDVYDADRDAFSFRGSAPVIAHPPCRGWGRYRHRSNHTLQELDLARVCLRHCQANGGVLEHPASSALWAEEGLPLPGGKGKAPHPSGWTLAIDQHWFGHPARKRTWLYIVGVTRLPPLPLSLAPENDVERLGRAAREHTPQELAKWLVQLVLPLASDASRLDLTPKE